MALIGDGGGGGKEVEEEQEVVNVEKYSGCGGGDIGDEYWFG